MGTPFRVKAPSVIKDNDVHSGNVFIMELEEESGYFDNSVDVEEIIQLAQREASIIIKEAEDEARRVLEKSKEDAQKNKVKIEEERAQGYEDGRKEAKKEYEEKIKGVDCIREKAVEEYGQILNSAESDIVDIILDISKKVLCAEIIQNKSVVFNLVREAIENCSYKNEAIVKVSPYEYDYIMQNKDELDLIFGDMENYEVRKDPSLQNGDCIIETSYGCVDTSIDAKFSKIEKAFREMCNTQNIDIKNNYAYVREEY